ncbi:FAD-binding oxidoreductase [Rubrobacter taiwanensis]|uniref:D-lactate dehydrogenase (cytochrome) n=1 Tax=Rubrobacter taiwanensis TaxID=185139 RepID=A0A4R1BQ73_9ACTN|nr:FAD-binding oxidoreductase [Rubrobacter taiwanensis]
MRIFRREHRRSAGTQEVAPLESGGPFSTRTGAVARDLRRLLSESQVVDEPGELQTFAYDASFETQLNPRPPEVAVIAGSKEDIQALVRYAHERGIPVTPRGAASGQAAGAVAFKGGIILSLNAMNRILEVDEPNLQVFCEPGVVHAQLNAALKPRGILFPPDPGSTKMATVGGMASTNAAGMRAVKYGPTGAWVLGLDVVLPDGSLIETGSAGSRAKQSSAGLELTKLFVGAEGTLGIITRLRLKLMPIPPARAIVTALFDDLESAGRAVQETFAAGVSPSAIEILDERCIRAINRYRPGMDLPPVEAMLLFEVDGNPPGVRWDAEKVAGVVRPLAHKVEWSDEPQRIAALWEARSLVGAAIGALRPGSNRAYCGEDICVPVSRIPETLREIQEIGKRYRIPIATYGHIAGGNLHPGHLIDASNPDEIRRVLQVADEIHALALRMNGTITGEHGVGAVRSPYMRHEHGLALEAMRQIKEALDPKGIMNPAKLFPN